MFLYEYEVKNIFRKFGIPIPEGWVASSPLEVREIIARLNRPAVLKAQVLTSGRGKSGGIRFVSGPEEAEKEAVNLFKTEIGGFKVTKLLVEEKLNITKELYLGVTVDNTYGTPIIMASSEGGVDIEEVVSHSPEKIVFFYPNILRGIREYEVRRLVKQIGLSGSLLSEVSRILYTLYHIFRLYDAELVEINPLAITTDDKVVAVDARLNIDDHALFRHPDFKELIDEHFENPFEIEGRRRGVNFVDLKGNIAVMGNGAGLVMALLDAIKMAGGEPACFLDIGGGMSAKRVEDALDLILMKASNDHSIKVIFFAFWFMISPAEEVVESFTNMLSRKRISIPMIGVVQGIGAEHAIKALESAGIKCYPTIKEGVEAAVKIVQGVI